jgi:hypothetical protein
MRQPRKDFVFAGLSRCAASTESRYKDRDAAFGPVGENAPVVKTFTDSGKPRYGLPCRLLSNQRFAAGRSLLRKLRYE